VKLANDRGGDDNVTTIVLKVKVMKNTRLNLSRMKAITSRYISKYFTSGKN
jgi:serine/threonine protein phosphatase PrpC